MQLLYLVPPALLLWVNYGSGDGAFIVIVPVLVMAAGQLAGGLAWLAISGEDAHDLVATAPLASRTVLRAKVEAVLAVIAIVLLPILALLAFASWPMALVTAVCATLSASASTAIQLWFRVVAKRSMFRRRQVASRAATLSEAFSSIMWAGTGALWAAGSLLAIAPAFVALAVLGLARLIAPKSK
jgi:ABC-2 type transport system permease protein